VVEQVDQQEVVVEEPVDIELLVTDLLLYDIHLYLFQM
jgi:hypothetical protein